MLSARVPALFSCAALVALPWLWPFTYGPTAAVLPYLMAAAAAALLLALWPRDAQAGVAAAAGGWLAAAVCSSAIALLQYFDAEAPFYPWINMAAPGQAFGNVRQPNQLATLLVMGLLALRWWGQQGLARGVQAGLAALLLAALAATASRVGLLELLALGGMALCWAWRGARGPGRWALAAALGAALAVYVAAAVGLPTLLAQGEGVAGRSMVERLQNAEGTCGSRLILWDNVLHLIAQKPWTGWGWGELAYAHYATLYPGARFCHVAPLAGA